MVNTEDKLNEIVKYTNEDTFKYWILISYRKSLWKGQTFKEAEFINIEESHYLKENIFKKDNQRVKLEIEEVRTISFPLGSIVDDSGNLILTPIGSSIKNFVYKNSILIDPYEDFILPFDKEETFDTEFINGVPCYYIKKKDSNTTFIIPVHVLLDFFFYQNTHVINILINDFPAILHLKKMDENVLAYPSTIIPQDPAMNIGRYFFTKYNTGHRALMKINDHQSVWLNQAKKNEEPKAYIYTNFPFGIKSYLFVNGIYLTDKDSEDRKFLVFSIENAKPANKTKTFFEIDKVILSDLTDKRSSDLKDEKTIVEYNNVSINQIVQGSQDNGQGLELSNEPVNNSLPQVENDTIKNRKFDLNPDFEKLDRLDQLNRYVKNKEIIKEIKNLSSNYNTQDGNNNTARYQAIEAKSFSFFKVFFKAIELLKKTGFSINYLTLDDKNLNSKLTLAPSGIETKKRLRFLVVSICQIEIESHNYIIIESGENHYIGVFACTNNYSFNLMGDIRIKTFLEKVINIHNYNWSKVNAEENFNFQKEDNIKIFRPIEHERSESKSLRKINSDNDVIDILASKLAEKIKSRVQNDIKENY